MPYNPALPADHSPLNSAEMRGQLAALDAAITTALAAAATDAAANSSANTNGVAFVNLAVSDPPTQAEMQTLASKLDELIAALRR